MTVYTLFGQPANPATLTTDAASITVGMEFSLSQNASLTGIWWWTPGGASSLPASCCIYQITGSDTGSQVAGTVNNSPSWSGGAGSNTWVKCSYDGSITLNAATNYRVCINSGSPGGSWYGGTGDYWDTGPGASGLTSGIISAPGASAADGGNQDAFVSGSTLAYPTTSFAARNFWVDVEVTSSGGGGGSGGITVGTTPVQVAGAAVHPAARWSGSLRLSNGAAAIYLGGPNVTPSNGFQVAANATWPPAGSPAAPLFPGDQIWACTASGTSTVQAFQTGG